MIKLIRKFLVFTNLITFQKQPTGYCLLKAQSLFFLWTSIRGVGSSSIPTSVTDAVMAAISAHPSVSSGTYIATYCNPELFVLKKCSLQEVAFWMDNGHPSLQRNLAPEETQVYQNAEQDCAQCCGGPGSSCGSVPCLHWNRLQVSFKSGFCSAIQGPGLAPGNASPRLCYNSIVI